VPDLRNALGHFNLTVTDNEYIIEDVYEFYYRTDKGQVVRHGPRLTEDDEAGARMQSLAKKLLPHKAYKNRMPKVTRGRSGLKSLRKRTAGISTSRRNGC
jgi:hypothetical protein